MQSIRNQQQPCFAYNEQQLPIPVKSSACTATALHAYTGCEEATFAGPPGNQEGFCSARVRQSHGCHYPQATDWPYGASRAGLHCSQRPVRLLTQPVCRSKLFLYQLLWVSAFQHTIGCYFTGDLFPVEAALWFQAVHVVSNLPLFRPYTSFLRRR